MNAQEQDRPEVPQPAPPAPKSDGSIHLFRFAGIDVFVNWMWFIAFICFVSSARKEYDSQVWGGIECLGLFGIVLLHEFGHAFACRSTGGKADRIVLWLLGGVAYVQPPPRPGVYLWSIAAGPLVNVALIPVTWGIYYWGSKQPWAIQAPDLLLCMHALAGLNVGILLFNMLPIYPLDGGQIVQSLLWFVIGRAYSMLVASVVGFATAVAAGLAAFYYEYLPIPYTHFVIPRPFSFLLPIFIIMRSSAAFKQAKTLVRLQGMRRIQGQACPACRERPLADDLWVCDQCQAHYNPYNTNNACPQCGKKHETVQCPFCGEWSETEKWRR